MKWKFVFFENHWRVAIYSIEQLMLYHEKTDYRWARAVKDYITVYEGQAHYSDSLANHIDVLARIWGGEKGLSFVDATLRLKQMVITNCINHITENKVLLFNQVGGYMIRNDLDEFDKIKEKDDLMFPSFGEKDIRIKQWGGDAKGTHYYAYIGDMQVTDGDILKWSTYAEAFEQAKKYVTTNEEAII
jgi:hypothetical protein